MDQLSKIAHFLKLVVIIYQLVLMEAVPSCSRLFFFLIQILEILFLWLAVFKCYEV